MLHPGDLLRFVRDWLPHVPDAPSAMVMLATAPPAPFVPLGNARPPGGHGQRGLVRVAWCHFVAGSSAIHFDEQHAEEFSSDLAADLREAVGRYPTDHGLTTLVTRLRAESPHFARRWGEARVARHRASRKTATSTPAGPIEIDCDVLTVPGNDLRLVVYTAAPGSEDASKLELLKVAGVHARI
jgi:hypothetical protein